MIRYLRKGKGSWQVWTCAFVALVVVACGISAAGIGLLADAVGGGQDFGLPLLIDGAQLSVRTTGRATSDGWLLPINGDLGEYLNFRQPGIYRIIVLAKGTPARGVWPRLRLVIDGKPTDGLREVSIQWNAWSWTVPLSQGTHKVTVRFVNDAVSGSEDRNLLLAKLAVRAATGQTLPTISTRAEWLRERS